MAENVEVELWERQPGEPKHWYLRFLRYYLYRGLARSVRRAYVAFVKENYPGKAEDIIVRGRSYGQWLKAAKRYGWRERAEAWDMYRNNELRREVLEASRFLMEHARDAAETLVESFKNPRLAVSAANSVLDRAGLPAVSRQELVDYQVQLSADELAKIKNEVKNWEEEEFSGRP